MFLRRTFTRKWGIKSLETQRDITLEHDFRTIPPSHLVRSCDGNKQEKSCGFVMLSRDQVMRSRSKESIVVIIEGKQAESSC